MRQPEGTDPADRMAGQFADFFRGQHLSFAESGLELAVVDTAVAARHQHDHPAIAQADGQCLGNASGLDAVRFSG